MESPLNKVCSIPWCRSSGPSLTFTNFPSSSEKIRQLQWLTMLDLAESWKNIPCEKIGSYVICSLHFDIGGTLKRAKSTPLTTTIRSKEDSQQQQHTFIMESIEDEPSSSDVSSSKTRLVDLVLEKASKGCIPEALLSQGNPSAAGPSIKTRESFSLGKKIEVIRALESGMKQSQVSKTLNIHKSSVNHIWKMKDKIIEAFLQSGPARKKVRKSRFEEVDNALFKWYSAAMSQNVAVTTKMLQMMAETFAKDLGFTESVFLCSSGWLERFKGRHNIKLKKPCNEPQIDFSGTCDNSRDSLFIDNLLTPKAEHVENSDFAIPSSSVTSTTTTTTAAEVEFHQIISAEFLEPNISDPLAFTKQEIDDNHDDDMEEDDEEQGASSISILPSTSLPIMRISSNDQSGSSNSSDICISNSTNDSTVQESKDWIKNTWSKLRESYAPSDIFSAEEMGLLYRIQPHEAYDICRNQSEFQKSFNVGKERITVLLCSNSVGTEKKRLLVVGQEKKPSSLTSVISSEDFSRLPVDYQSTSNINSWMTEYNFLQWIFSWDMKLKEKENNRKILLLLNQSPIHSDSILNSITLNNIKIILLPQNITSILQPMKQGVTQEFKLRYRRLVLQRLIFYLEQKKFHFTISLFDALCILNTAWNEITSKAIASTFKISRLVSSNTEDAKVTKSYKTFQVSYQGGNVDCRDIIQRAQEIGLPIPKDWKLQEFVDVDDCLLGPNADAEGHQITLSSQDTLLSSQESLTNLQRIRLLSQSEIQQYLDDIKIWTMNKSEHPCPQEVHDAISTIESYIYNH